jgi:hypothetical protein
MEQNAMIRARYLLQLEESGNLPDRLKPVVEEIKRRGIPDDYPKYELKALSPEAERINKYSGWVKKANLPIVLGTGGGIAGGALGLPALGLGAAPGAAVGAGLGGAAGKALERTLLHLLEQLGPTLL